MTSWKDKMAERFKSRLAERSGSTAAPERSAPSAEPRKLPVAGPPPARPKTLSDREASRVLNLASSAGVFREAYERYAKVWRDHSSRAARDRAAKVLWKEIRLQAEDLLGDERPPTIWDAVEIGWSSTNGRPRFHLPHKRAVRKRGWSE